MRISDWSSDVCSSDVFACRYLPDVTRIRWNFFFRDVLYQSMFAESAWRVNPQPAARCFFRLHERRRGSTVNGPTRRARRRNGQTRRAGGENSCRRSEEHTSELQSLMRISYAV